MCICIYVCVYIHNEYVQVLHAYICVGVHIKDKEKSVYVERESTDRWSSISSTVSAIGEVTVLFTLSHRLFSLLFSIL